MFGDVDISFPIGLRTLEIYSRNNVFIPSTVNNLSLYNVDNITFFNQKYDFDNVIIEDFKNIINLPDCLKIKNNKIKYTNVNHFFS